MQPYQSGPLTTQLCESRTKPGFATSRSDFERVRLFQWRMRAQMDFEDGWDLILDNFPTLGLQDTPKSCPLLRPEVVLQPRIPAVFHVSRLHAPGTPRPVMSGPRLTAAGLSQAAPMVSTGYDPVRCPLNHQVSNAARDEYHPDSLRVRSNASEIPEPGEEQPMVPFLCTSTAAALPCLPISKGNKVETKYPKVRTSTTIQWTRLELTRENSFFGCTIYRVIGTFWTLFSSFRVIVIITIC